MKRKKTRCEGEKAQMQQSGEKFVIRRLFEGFFLNAAGVDQLKIF